MGCTHTPFRKTVGDPTIEPQNSKFKNPPSPIAWTIAGSDSGGGAGIQADLKVMNAFGVHGCSVITALTAQNTRGVQSTEPVSEAMLRAQLQALETDLPPAAIKTGMLGSLESCKIVADFLERYEIQDTGYRIGQNPDGSCILNPESAAKPLLVCDPVLKSTSGADLLDPEALDILINEILPQVDVLTPNLPEVETIIGEAFKNAEDAAAQLLTMGVGSVLIKGGHGSKRLPRTAPAASSRRPSPPPLRSDRIFPQPSPRPRPS